MKSSELLQIGRRQRHRVVGVGNAHRLREVGLGSGKSPFGMLDMVGNAWEWTSSEAKAYPGGSEFVKNSLKQMVIRGGYWGSNIKTASAVGRRAYGATGEKEGYPNTGFRCVKDPDR